MDRSAVIDYATGQFAVLVAATGLPDSAVYNPSADHALRALGVAEADLAAPTIQDTQASDVLALMDYYTLRAVWRGLALAVDVTMDTPVMDKKRSQLFKQVGALLASAKADIEARGYGVADDFALGRLNLDYLEPAPTGIPFWWG